MFFTLVKPPRELAQVVDVDVDRLYFPRTLFYSFLIASFLFLVLAAIRFLTVEADESWILLSIGHLIGGPFAGMGVLSGPVVTSGGLYAVMHYPLMLAGTSVEIHRMVSFVFAGLTILAVYLIIRAQGARTWVALFGVVAFLTVPGLLLQAGMATAEMMATFLVIVGAWYWTDRGSLTLAGSVRSGLLFGLACATRTSAFIVVPAIIAWGALYHRSFRHLMTNTLIACGVACVVFILGTATLYALFRAGNEANFGDVATFFGKTTGLTAKRGLTSCMAYFFASNNLVPTFTIAVPAIALALGLPAGSFAKARPLCALLVLIGLIGWMGWILRAPFPHVRYLYPALPALWLAATILLLEWLTELDRGRPRLLLEAGVIAAFAAQFVISLREVYYGDTLAVVYEAVGVAPIRGPAHGKRVPPFEARRDQNKIGSVLSGLDGNKRICALMKELSYPLTILTGVKVKSLLDQSGYTQTSKCDYLIVFPAEKNIWIPSRRAIEWIINNTKLYAQVGDYSLYEIAPGEPVRQLVPDGLIGDLDWP
jgi:hypothetical protein